MEPVARRLESLVPRGTDVLVDVANQRPHEIAAVHRDYARPLYVSTHKTFNFSQLSIGAHTADWLVLVLPEADAGRTSRTRAFDVTQQRFREQHPAPDAPSSPVHIRYQMKARPSQCRILSPQGSTGYAHRWCEVDDDVLAVLARRTGLPVVTNDRELGRRVRASHPPTVETETLSLLRHSRLTLLAWRDGRWVVRTRRG